MLYGLKSSMVVANKYLTQEEAFEYIVNYSMYTPIKMTKEEGQKKKREFTAGKFGRLFNDWKATNQSPNEELKGNLQTIRDRARDLERNNPIIQRYFQLLKQGVVGVGEGFKIKVRARNFI